MEIILREGRKVHLFARFAAFVYELGMMAVFWPTLVSAYTAASVSLVRSSAVNPLGGHLSTPAKPKSPSYLLCVSMGLPYLAAICLWALPTSDKPSDFCRHRTITKQEPNKIRTMAIFSAKTLILFRSCFLWSMGYLIVSHPTMVTDHPLVVLIGKSMELPPVAIDPSNQLTGLLGAVLITAGLSDIPILATDGDAYLTVNLTVGKFFKPDQTGKNNSEYSSFY